jgi:S1-C subfamily serine protease
MMNKLNFVTIFVAGAALALSPTHAGAQEAARPVLGVRIQVQPEGAVISEILPGQTAAAVGFQVGDILLEAGGRPISQEVLQEYWGQVREGDQVSFKVQRAGSVVELTGRAVAAPGGPQAPAAQPEE